MRGTLEHLGVGITRIDHRGCFLEINQKFCDILGYSREELIGRATREVTVPEDYGPGPAFREQAQRGQATVLTGGKRYIRKDGTHIWVRRTISPAFDETGGSRDTISVIEDITERKRAEESISREQLLLKTIIDALPDYVYVKDTQDRIQLGNKAWLEARRLRADEARGKSVFDIFPQPVAQRMHDQDRRIIESGAPVIDQETPIFMFGEDGAKVQRWSLTSKVPMHDDGGNIIGIVGISRDITARRNLERERALEQAVARVLAESRSIAETMSNLIRVICDAMGWLYGARWVWDAELNNLRRAEWWCAFEPEFDPADARSWTQVDKESVAGLMHAAWVEQKPTWFRDIGEIKDFRRRKSYLKFGFRSGFAFPILAHQESVGAMEFFGREMLESDEVLPGISSAISNQTGQFILRKQAEEALLENEQQLGSMFDNADVGITMTGLDMRFLRVNDKYCSLLGYTREELLRMSIPQVNLKEDLDAMVAYRERIPREIMPRATNERRLVRKDGALIWASLAASPVRARRGYGRTPERGRVRPRAEQPGQSRRRRVRGEEDRGGAEPAVPAAGHGALRHGEHRHHAVSRGRHRAGHPDPQRGRRDVSRQGPRPQ